MDLSLKFFYLLDFEYDSEKIKEIILRDIPNYINLLFFPKVSTSSELLYKLRKSLFELNHLLLSKILVKINYLYPQVNISYLSDGIIFFYKAYLQFIFKHKNYNCSLNLGIRRIDNKLYIDFNLLDIYYIYDFNSCVNFSYNIFYDLMRLDPLNNNIYFRDNIFKLILISANFNNFNLYSIFSSSFKFFSTTKLYLNSFKTLTSSDKSSRQTAKNIIINIEKKFPMFLEEIKKVTPKMNISLLDILEKIEADYSILKLKNETDNSS